MKGKHTYKKKERYSDDELEVVLLATAWVTALAVRVGGEIRVPEEEIRALIEGRGAHRFEVEKTDGAYVIRVTSAGDGEADGVREGEPQGDAD